MRKTKTLPNQNASHQQVFLYGPWAMFSGDLAHCNWGPVQDPKSRARKTGTLSSKTICLKIHRQVYVCYVFDSFGGVWFEDFAKQLAGRFIPGPPKPLSARSARRPQNSSPLTQRARIHYHYPQTPSLLWFWGPSSINVVYMDCLGAVNSSSPSGSLFIEPYSSLKRASINS